ncbi:MAG: SUMF1/EgtB/PvdO family nonheme iron enzyme [Planctomycetota bacterium]|nr:hypothetical protein [Planctomycetota bacterium]MDP6518958.1 SUMF1/EgtB/PvdO family nonheme iron enzyme [Planctomycetota bacterium]MDP6837929.1 SUMF1/EgtB/PvdO family nonheme iron enzyme [Planctomycetota bacterium]
MVCQNSPRFLSLGSLLATALVAWPLSAPASGQGLGTNYCTGAPNSTGVGAVMDASGSQDVTHNNLTLSATSMPTGQMGIFFYGPDQDSEPFGDGYRCVAQGGLGLFRLNPPGVTAGGELSHVVDLGAPPHATGQIAQGSTWNFQAWYRDPDAQGAGHNLSDGYEITFAPVSGAYDGMALVPAGTFEMGRHVGSGNSDELPVHTVNLDAFYMDIFEVTIAEYAEYLNSAMARGELVVYEGDVYYVGESVWLLCETGAKSDFNHLQWDGTVFSADPNHPVSGSWADHPMDYVTWYGACAYANGKSRDAGLDPCYEECAWLCDFTKNGYRLPTEAEWEYAARGGEHNPYYMYPWGDSVDGSQANYALSGDPYEDVACASTPVGYYDGNQTPAGVDMANGYGLYDMIGNVEELCWDLEDEDYYSNSPTDNPRGPNPYPGASTRHIVRGGNWRDHTDYNWFRSAYRGDEVPDWAGKATGLRVVANRP